METTEKKPKKKKAKKEVDLRAFTMSDKQSYIFRCAKQIIQGKMSIDGVSYASQSAVRNILNRFREGKININQINSKCATAEGTMIISNGENKRIYGIIGSKGYKFIKNPNYQYKKGTYYYLYYYLPIHLINSSTVSHMLKYGINPYTHGIATTKCEFTKHPNCAIVKIVTNVCPKKVDGGFHYNAINEKDDNGNPIDRIPSKDIHQIIYNAIYEKDIKSKI